MPKLSSNISASIGKKIKFLRKLNKFSQSALAALLGITFQQLQKYEKGTSKLSVDRIKQIAGVFSVNVGYFFDENSDQNSANEVLQMVEQNATVVRLLKDLGEENMPYFINAAKYIGKINNDSIKNILIEFMKVASK